MSDRKTFFETEVSKDQSRANLTALTSIIAAVLLLLCLLSFALFLIMRGSRERSRG